MCSENQKCLFEHWAQGTSFTHDTTKQPKAEFARLAKVKGWVGGDRNWRAYWALCFEEQYPYGAGKTTIEIVPEKATITMPGASRKSDLVGRARRLSAASDLSSYSIVSGAPTVYSLDTNDSLDGGVIVTPPADEELGARLSSLTIEDPVVSPGPDFARSTVASNDTLEARIASYKPAVTPTTSDVSGFWLQFDGFEPNPTASFKAELARLAAHQNWSTQTKRQRQVEALIAEAAFHYGTCMDKLNHWQQLCEDVGVEDIPCSITKCKKALRPILVNLYNLIDHCRNPDVEVRRFVSYTAFSKYTRAGRTFPKECAKQDGFIRVLLKRV